MNVLVLNAGSSSLKYKLFTLEIGKYKEANTIATGDADVAAEGMENAVAVAISDVRDKCDGIDAVGHRFVHGGPEFRDPILLNDDAISKLMQLRELDPLHNPLELTVVRAASRALPDVPAVAVFDTAFHATLPEIAWRYAVPRGWADDLKLRRYGFHGISYQYISSKMRELTEIGRVPEKMIVCHLGSGSSVCALLNGVSKDTSMGMTPLEGLIMGTRCGDVDPGLILYLLREGKIDLSELDDLLNHKSGLAGLAEGSGGDVRKLASETANPAFQEALGSFSYRVRKYIGGYAAALGGLDALVFTGGIGENSARVRSMICEGLQFLGIEIDNGLNDPVTGPHQGVKVSASSGSVGVWVVPTDEETEIAHQTARLIESISKRQPGEHQNAARK